jgi:hypothetical protein
MVAVERTSESSSRRGTVGTRGGGAGYRWCRQTRLCYGTVGLLAASILYIIYQAAWTYYLPGVGIEDSYLDERDGHVIYRRKPERLYKNHHGAAIEITELDGIFEGHLTLVDLKISKQQKTTTTTTTKQEVGDSSSYGDGVMVRGVFCHIAWDKQATASWQVPMFKDLRAASKLCAGTIYAAENNLAVLATMLRQYDMNNHTFAAVERPHGHGSANPTLVVFHESRCGSTLVANTLSVIGRVYSEAPPPVSALLACERYGICGTAQLQLIRDVFYIMGRAPTPQRVSYKIQSIGSREIATFRKAMPNTPWMFVYRDGIEVLMSHFRHYQFGKNDMKYTPNCLRALQSKAPPHPAFTAVVEPTGKAISDLTREEYCAAHLASLLSTALSQAHDAPRQHDTIHDVIGLPNDEHVYLVNYDQLPHIMWDVVLNELLVGGVTKSQRLQMHDIATHYSKQRTDGKEAEEEEQHWREDNTLKQGRAPPSVKAAAALFLDPLYLQLETIRVGAAVAGNGGNGDGGGGR